MQGLYDGPRGLIIAKSVWTLFCKASAPPRFSFMGMVVERVRMPHVLLVAFILKPFVTLQEDLMMEARSMLYVGYGFLFIRLFIYLP